MANTGFRPGSRSTFISAKVNNAIGARFGHSGWSGPSEAGRINSLGSKKVRRIRRAPNPRAEQQAASENRMERPGAKKHALEIIFKDYKTGNEDAQLRESLSRTPIYPLVERMIGYWVSSALVGI